MNARDRGHIAPLLVLLMILFFTGSVCAAYLPQMQERPARCCDQEPVPEAPPSEGECFDCRCLTCSGALFSPSPFDIAVGNISVRHLSLPAALHPSEHIQSIDCPPERV